MKPVGFYAASRAALQIDRERSPPSSHHMECGGLDTAFDGAA
jgi:hypothetical protein